MDSILGTVLVGLWQVFHTAVGIFSDIMSASMVVPMIVVMLVIYAVGLVTADMSVTIEGCKFRPFPQPPEERGSGLISAGGTERKWVTIRCTMRASKYAITENVN